MKNIGRKKTRGFHPEVIAGKEFIDVPDYMEYIGYSRTNRASFSRLRNKKEIPPYICVGGKIYFRVDKVIKFYSETLLQRQKTASRPSFSVS